MQGGPHINHVATCPSARKKRGRQTDGEGRSTPDEKLRPPVHNNTSNSDSDTSMSVRGREWHQYVGVCGKQQRERGRRGKGLSARRRTGCRPAEDQQVGTFPPFPRGVVTVLARKERKRRREGEAAREGGASGRRERAAREEGGGSRGAWTAIPPAVRKQCGSSAEAVRKQCGKAAEAVRR